MGGAAEMDEKFARSTVPPASCIADSTTQTSSILSPSKLDIPKRKKGWERAARPAANSDSKVKVVWENWDLRRAKAGVGSRRQENEDDAEEPGASPPRVLKKARVAAHPNYLDQHTKSKDYVITGRERRASRSPSRRKLPAVEEQSALHNMADEEDYARIDAHQEEGYASDVEIVSTYSDDDQASLEAGRSQDVANAQAESTVTQPAVHDIQAEAASPPSLVCTDHVTWEGAMPNHSFAPAMHDPIAKISDGQSSDSDEEGGTVDEELTAVATSTAAPASPEPTSALSKILDTPKLPAQQAEELPNVAANNISQGTDQDVEATGAMGLIASREQSLGNVTKFEENANLRSQEEPVETMTREKDLSLTDLDLRTGIASHASQTEKLASDQSCGQAGEVSRKLLMLPSIDDLAVLKHSDRDSPLQHHAVQTSIAEVELPLQPFPALEDEKEIQLGEADEKSSLPTLIKVDFGDDPESDLSEAELSDEEDGLDYNDTMKLNGLQPHISSEIEADEHEEEHDEEFDDEIAAEGTLPTEDSSDLLNHQVEAEDDSDESTEACQARDVTVPILPAHDDKAILSSFLARAAASKAARSSVVTRRASLQNRLESETVRQALSSPSRQALEEKDVNISPSRESSAFASPSTAMLPGLRLLSNSGSRPASPSMGILKFTAAPPLSPAPEPAKRSKKQQEVSDSPLRRSSRNASSAQASVASAAAQKLRSISVGMQDTPDPTSLAIEAEAKKLMNQTRNNTRKNKGAAVGVKPRLKQLNGTARGKAADQTAGSAVEVEIVEDDRGATKLRWREVMCDYQEAPELPSPIRSRAPIRKAPASKIRISRVLAAATGLVAEADDDTNVDENKELPEHGQPVGDEANEAKSGSPQKKKPGKQRQLKKPQTKQTAPSVQTLQTLILPDEHLDVGEKSQLNGVAISGISTAPSALPIPVCTDLGSSTNGKLDTRIPTAKDSRDFKSSSVVSATATQVSKLPSLVLAPSIKSVSAPAVNGLTASDGKENLASKLRSPKKISMLPMPTPSLLSTATLSTMQAAGRPAAAHGSSVPMTDPRMNGGSESGALSTPARKRAGVKRKKAA